MAAVLYLRTGERNNNKERVDRVGKRIYLSPAAHATDNSTACPFACGENIHCNAYMDLLEARLIALGFEVMRGDKTLTGTKAMRARVAQANQWGADIYYVAHTNAGGGRYSLTLCWPSEESKTLANVLHKYRTSVASHKVRTRRDLYEIKATTMPCLYDELFFHDNAEDCAWFHTGGMQALAEETAQALCEMCGVPYAVPKADGTTDAAVTRDEAPQAGDVVRLQQGALYVSARGSKAVTRTGTFYLYDGVKVGNRYRVTNALSRVGKAPIWANVSGWVEL